MQRQSAPAGTIWGDRFGYSRAVRVGQTIHVSGTAASDDEGRIHGEGDPHAQAMFALQRIAAALQQLGGTMHDVVRTRVYLTDIEDWEPVAAAHARFFGSVKPASTLLAVSELIDPALLVEIEAVAVVDADAGPGSAED